MVIYSNHCNLKDLKKKLMILYVLNVTDIICTLLLLKSGHYIEANPFMGNIINTPHAAFILKIILPAILFVYMYIRIIEATQAQLKMSNIFINIAATIYVLINVSHLIWFSLLGILIAL